MEIFVTILIIGLGISSIVNLGRWIKTRKTNYTHDVINGVMFVIVGILGNEMLLLVVGIANLIFDTLSYKKRKE